LVPRAMFVSVSISRNIRVKSRDLGPRGYLRPSGEAVRRLVFTRPPAANFTGTRPLPRVNQHLLSPYPVQPRKPQAGRDLCHKKDHQGSCQYRIGPPGQVVPRESQGQKGLGVRS
jgi:hypothetical protein